MPDDDYVGEYLEGPPEEPLSEEQKEMRREVTKEVLRVLSNNIAMARTIKSLASK